MVNIIAEVGINHNGSISIAKDLITIAKSAGCDFVKFQKRTPSLIPENQKNKIKWVPWSTVPVTYLEYKQRMEFNEDEYFILAEYAAALEIDFFASVWDIPSAEFMKIFTNIAKIPSAKITDLDLLECVREEYDVKLMSTGMSTEEQINRAMEILEPDVIFHTNSSYPCTAEQIRFGYMQWLKEKYCFDSGLSPFLKPELGYSNHFYGIIGATWVEVHITRDHEMWGSDQKASVEPHGLFKMVKAIRELEEAMKQGYGPREIWPEEQDKLKSLRG